MNLANLCIKCGRCLEVCPLFTSTLREDFSPRGKWTILSNSPKLSLSEIKHFSTLCLGCEKCALVCTQGLNFAEYLADFKACSSDWKIFATQKLLQFINSSNLLALAKYKFSSQDKNAYFLLTPSSKKIPFKKAVIFPGCLAKIFPNLEEKLKQLLAALEINIIPTPNWKCCGKPFQLAGLKEQSQNFATHNLNLWEELGKPIIITFCATCFKGLKNSFPQNSILLAENLLKYFSIQTLTNQNILIHQSCHSMDIPLHKIWPTLKIISKCCGFGGSFKVLHSKWSKEINNQFWSKIPESSVVFTNCLGCLIELKVTLPKNLQVFHWIEKISLKET
ncbi:(Fe-S)-binding protein [Desulfonauticus submarinus]